MRRPETAARLRLAGVAAVSVAAVGAALVSQHVFGMQPCPWCVLQRVIFLAIAIVCLLGAIGPTIVRRIGAALGSALALCGVAAALWQHFQAASSASCGMTLADTIVAGWLQLDQWQPDVFSARASCADAAVNLFGVPYDFWSLALFALIAMLLVRVLPAQKRR